MDIDKARKALEIDDKIRRLELELDRIKNCSNLKIQLFYKPDNHPYEIYLNVNNPSLAEELKHQEVDRLNAEIGKLKKQIEEL